MSAPGGPAPGAAPDGAQARRGLVLLAMTGSLSMIFIDMTVVGVALPRIGASLGMDDVGQAWIVTSYLLSLASLMAIGGRIGDLVGKVPAFLVGVVAFAAASAVCAFARDGTQMIMGRVLQGVAACLMQPASGALVIGAFAPGERGKAMAAYVGIPMVFMALGPALGGVIVERWGWEWVFLLNLPIAATAVALTLVARPRDARSTDRHIDWLGGGLLLLGLPPLVFGIQQLGAARADGSLRWDDPVTIAALVGGAVALATFGHRQWNHPRPLLRLRLFADHALAADLHARLDDSPNVPQAWRNRLRELSDRAIGFAREVAGRIDNEGDARRATSLLYHVASAVALAWEGGRIHEMRGDARRLLLSRMVVDHRVMPGDPFRLAENTVQRRMTEHLLGDRAIGMAEVGELLVAA
jgi:hypothetical protein